MKALLRTNGPRGGIATGYEDYYKLCAKLHLKGVNRGDGPWVKSAMRLG